MKTVCMFALAVAAATFSGCVSSERIAPSPSQSMAFAASEPVAREPIITSLFPSDQAVLGDEAVARILASKLEMPVKSKLALMKFPEGRGYGRYWHDEDYLKLQEAQVDMLSKALLGSDHIAEVMPLPSLMTPKQVSIPTLREAAVRMQADLLLVYRINSATYSQYRAFSKDKVKVYSTCELVLLDVRTGLVPFTRVVSRDRLEVKQPADFDLAETTRRAEQGSATEALKSAGDDLVRFVKAAPKKGG